MSGRGAPVHQESSRIRLTYLGLDKTRLAWSTTPLDRAQHPRAHVQLRARPADRPPDAPRNQARGGWRPRRRTTHGCGRSTPGCVRSSRRRRCSWELSGCSSRRCRGGWRNSSARPGRTPRIQGSRRRVIGCGTRSPPGRRAPAVRFHLGRGCRGYRGCSGCLGAPVAGYRRRCPRDRSQCREPDRWLAQPGSHRSSAFNRSCFAGLSRRHRRSVPWSASRRTRRAGQPGQRRASHHGPGADRGALAPGSAPRSTGAKPPVARLDRRRDRAPAGPREPRGSITCHELSH